MFCKKSNQYSKIFNDHIKMKNYMKETNCWQTDSIWEQNWNDQFNEIGWNKRKSDKRSVYCSKLSFIDYSPMMFL